MRCFQYLSVTLLRSVSCVFTIKIGLDFISQPEVITCQPSRPCVCCSGEDQSERELFTGGWPVCRRKRAMSWCRSSLSVYRQLRTSRQPLSYANHSPY